MLAVAAVCACGGMALGQDDEDTAPPKTISIGTLADYPDAAFYDKFRDQKIFVRRLDDRLVAMSAICTHKRCVLKIKDPATLRCPCHKSFFSAEGSPTEGPAKKSLNRYALTQNEAGEITVDTTQSFEEKEWEEPKSFIAIKKQ